ncbi:MAG: rod shape-determining protein MreD [Succinivibrio sp.]
MIKKEKQSSFLYVLIPMLILSIIIQILHMPSSVSDYRPDLLVLVILFFSINNNFVLKLETSWCVGIILDLVTGAPLGINAFLITCQIYLINTQFKNFDKYSLWQQTIIIGLVNLVVNVIGYWIEHIIGQSYYETTFIIPSLVTALMWPVIFVICIILCNTFSVESENKEKKSLS